jgi:hypothetical protein
MTNNKRYETKKCFDFTNWAYDWKEYTTQASKDDGLQSVAIADYLWNTIKVDKRNIATGGASDYEFVIHYPRPNLADSYGQSQWMPILVTQLLADVCKPKHILGISGGLDTYKLKPFQDIYGSKIYMLNNKKTSLYKKFQEKYAPIEHEVVSHQDLEKDNCNAYMFDMMIAWSQEMENPFVGPDFYLDRLNTNGILIIQNSSDSIFLYQNDTVASPTASYHEEIKLRKDCRMYHIPLFFGLTIVVKQ